MAIRPHDARMMREAFSKSGLMGKPVPDFTIKGKDFSPILSPDDNSIGIIVPCNTEGDEIYIVFDNLTLKRWHHEFKMGQRLVRRIAAGEKGTDYQQMQS